MEEREKPAELSAKSDLGLHLLLFAQESADRAGWGEVEKRTFLAPYVLLPPTPVNTYPSAFGGGRRVTSPRVANPSKRKNAQSSVKKKNADIFLQTHCIKKLSAANS